MKMLIYVLSVMTRVATSQEPSYLFHKPNSQAYYVIVVSMILGHKNAKTIVV